jgi:hypothetical protein
MVFPPVLQYLPQRKQERVGHRQVRRRGVSTVDDFGEGKLYADVVDVVVRSMVEVKILSERSFAVVRKSWKENVIC